MPSFTRREGTSGSFSRPLNNRERNFRQGSLDQEAERRRSADHIKRWWQYEDDLREWEETMRNVPQSDRLLGPPPPLEPQRPLFDRHRMTPLGQLPRDPRLQVPGEPLGTFDPRALGLRRRRRDT